MINLIQILGFTWWTKKCSFSPKLKSSLLNPTKILVPLLILWSFHKYCDNLFDCRASFVSLCPGSRQFAQITAFITRAEAALTVTHGRTNSSQPANLNNCKLRTLIKKWRPEDDSVLCEIAKMSNYMLYIFMYIAELCRTSKNLAIHWSTLKNLGGF